MSSVQSIDLSSNNLTGVDVDLSCFSSLTSIDLSFNNISSFVGIGNIPGLKELLLHKNQLTSLGGALYVSGLQHLNV